MDEDRIFAWMARVYKTADDPDEANAAILFVSYLDGNLDCRAQVEDVMKHTDLPESVVRRARGRPDWFRDVQEKEKPGGNPAISHKLSTGNE